MAFVVMARAEQAFEHSSAPASINTVRMKRMIPEREELLHKQKGTLAPTAAWGLGGEGEGGGGEEEEEEEEGGGGRTTVRGHGPAARTGSAEASGPEKGSAVVARSRQECGPGQEGSQTAAFAEVPVSSQTATR
ncbi:unnamed protein product [Prorocentrum cordatum]|uniref:Uncharacterized protein n=1 Tax=Prorocentrum cordatum TaxID=2364126 RepID=A0ABN9Q0N0_9DINO|nr:unnamed protein product [Polarella glacialis]